MFSRSFSPSKLPRNPPPPPPLHERRRQSNRHHRSRQSKSENQQQQQQQQQQKHQPIDQESISTLPQQYHHHHHHHHHQQQQQQQQQIIERIEQPLTNPPRLEELCHDDHEIIGAQMIDVEISTFSVSSSSSSSSSSSQKQQQQKKQPIHHQHQDHHHQNHQRINVVQQHDVLIENPVRTTTSLLEMEMTDQNSDSSMSGLPSWKNRLRLLRIFHNNKKELYNNATNNKSNENSKVDGDHELTAVTTKSTSSSSDENYQNNNKNKNNNNNYNIDGPTGHGLKVTTGDYKKYNVDVQRHQRQPNTLKNNKTKKRKAPYGIKNIDNHELKLPLHQQQHQLQQNAVGEDDQPTQSRQQRHHKSFHEKNINLQSSENNIIDGSNNKRWYMNYQNHQNTKVNETMDPVSDFDESEWTPMDSSYGAAIPLAGWIPKGIRRTIEFTVLVGIALIIVFFIVETSVRSDMKNHKSNNLNNFVSDDNNHNDDTVFYNYSNYDNTTTMNYDDVITEGDGQQ